MTWLKLDDKFWKHEKVADLSHQAFRLHVSALCMCADELTDGRVSERNLRQLVAVLQLRSVPSLVTELVEARLWSTHQRGGWRIKDFLEYNPSSVQVKEQRERNARRQERHRNAVTNSVTNGVSHAAPTRPEPVDSKNGSSLEPGVDNVAQIRALGERIGRSLES